MTGILTSGGADEHGVLERGRLAGGANRQRDAARRHHHHHQPAPGRHLDSDTASIAPNTVIPDAAGVKVTPNEQTLTGAGTDNEALLLNAIDVGLANAAQPIVGDALNRANLLSGGVVIGQSKASLSAVPDAAPIPEPASMLLLAAGLFGVGLCQARRRMA